MYSAACSKRGVLFILLLGFLLQSIIVVASEFFTYQTPTFEHYCFVGSACLMLFCMKLLYVDDSSIYAEDHALMVNKVSAFLFNVGQFSLLLSTTVLGSGLNLLTHDYLAATQALPGPSKNLVCGGFSAVLFSTFFVKSMHLKRVPADGRGQCLFITAYLIQAMTLLAVVGVTAAMCTGNVNGVLAALMESDILLLFSLSGAAFVVVLMHWLDEGVELALYGTSEASRSFRVHPFGFWWCLKPDQDNYYERSMVGASEDPSVISDAGFGTSELSVGESTTGLSTTTPLLGGSGPRDYSSTLGSPELV
uniref:Chitin synthase export chaperone n=1 Tax=Entomoneis paludosa TaxID=265537 RepID=A0A7S3DRC7_9STRA|mmetsp:Transcript_3000/g.6137  ORF Transcript_3000/g.6137 Transcript_3000/m.6137 type:complete len:307 (+) Transcript_3000:85-1005(+)